MKSIILTVLFLTASNFSLSQNWYKSSSIYDFTLYNQRIIYNDDSTYIASTPDTIYIINPSSVKKIALGDITILPHRSHFRMVEKHKGNYYFSYVFGMFEYNPNNDIWTLFNESNSDLPDDKIVAIRSVGEELVITSFYAGITIFNGDTFDNIYIGENLDVMPEIPNHIGVTYQEGFYFFSMDHHLSRYKDGKLEVVAPKDNYYDMQHSQDNLPSCEMIVYNDELYFATLERRFFKYDGNVITELTKFSDYFQKHDSLKIGSFDFDRDGNLVVGLQRLSFVGVFEYTYLVTQDGDDFVFYDIMQDLGIENRIGYMAKSTNGDLYFNSHNEFICNGDPDLSVEKDNEDLFLLNIYPNPVQSQLNLKFATTPSGKDQLKVAIYDIRGGIILSSNLNISQYNSSNGYGLGDVDISEVNPGIYILTLSTKNWSTAKMLIKK